MKSFVSEVIGINMKALGIVSIVSEAMGSYHVETNTDDGDDATFEVVNSKGQVVGCSWCTIEGASACAELLAGGYWKEK